MSGVHEMIFFVSYVEKHVPVVGEQCLWPPNTVSQCSSDQTPGMGCLNGQCEILHMKTCKTDTDCGFSQSSSLLCIEGM